MLRITVTTTSQVRTLRLEGRLGPPSLEELNKCWADAVASRKPIIQVDLTGVTNVDPEGRAILKVMHEGGAEFIAEDCLMIGIVEEIAGTTDSPTARRLTHPQPPLKGEPLK